MKTFIAMTVAALVGTPVLAMDEGDSLVASLMVDELEYVSQSGEDPTAWRAELMAGSQLDQFWLVSEGEQLNGGLEDHELRAYYSRAVTPHWNLLAGWRGDLHPEPERNWAMVGVAGAAPFFIETEVLLFVGDDNRSGLRVTLEKELILTQRWHLIPEVEFDVHGHNDEQTGTGSGLSSLEMALRLAYEVTPRFTPYLGVSWGRSYGRTADYLRDEGEDIDGGQVLLGVSFWL